jgi:hypothetical protein
MIVILSEAKDLLSDRIRAGPHGVRFYVRH